MAKSLEESLEKGIVIIKFQSLKSRNILSIVYISTTKYMNNPTHIIKQSGDKLLCYDVEFEKWEDIDKETILKWSKLT